MYLKGVENYIDVSGISILQLLQHLDLVQSNLDTVILLSSIDSIVMGVNIDDFKSNDSVFSLVMTREEED